MNSKVLSSVLIFSLALNLAVISTFLYKSVNGGDRFPGQRMFGGGRPGPEFFEQMKLDEGQRREIFKHIASFREISMESRREINKLEQELHDTILSEETEKDKIDMLVDSIGTLQTRMSKKVIDHFMEFRTVLSQDQQKIFFEMLMERRSGQRDKIRGRRDQPERFRNREFKE